MSWFSLDNSTQTIANGRLSYQYGHGYLHNGEGVSITHFVDGTSGVNLAYGFDGQYKDDAWDGSPVEIGTPHVNDFYADIPVRTGQTDKVDRLYRDAPILEITYRRNDADWTEDFIHAAGPENEITFVMYGMDDVVGYRQGKALWDTTEARYGHNYGDRFLAVNGSSVARCTYAGHYIYGFINRTTGHGAGFVYPTWITTKEWKVWWTESNKIEIEYAPHGKLGTRWIYAVSRGKEEVISIGKQLARRGSWLSFRL